MEKTKVKVKEHVRSPRGKMIALPKVTMGFGNILTSIEKEVYSDVLQLEGGGDLPSSKQVIVAVHDNNCKWQVGDIVELDFTMFPYETKPGNHDVGTVRLVQIPEETIDNRKYIYCTDRHVKYRYDS